DGNGEGDDGHGDGQAAGQRGQGGSQVGDDVVGGVHGDAEDSGHDKPSSGPDQWVRCWRRPRSRKTRRRRFLLLSRKRRGPSWVETRAATGPVRRGNQAAGAAEGARGRGPPAASGSRCRRNAADQDFFCKPAARPRNGAAVMDRAIRALPAIVAATRPARTTARTAALRTVSPAGPAEPVRMRPAK